jgi:hypothetical protein
MGTLISTTVCLEVPTNRTQEIESMHHLTIFLFHLVYILSAYIQMMGENGRASAAPLFCERSHHDYHRHRRTVEPIFTNIFPTWSSATCKLKVVEVTKRPKSAIYN